MRKLLDFDGNSLSIEWTATGPIEIARGPIPAPPEKGAKGQGLRIKTTGNGTAATRPNVVPGDWRRFREIRFWAYRSESSVGADVLNLQLLEADGRAQFRRQYEMSHTGWKQFSAPLAWFTLADGRVPRWDRIDRLAFSTAAPAELWVDEVELVLGDDDTAAILKPEQILAVAFPDKQSPPKVLHEPSVLLATDARQMDVAALAKHLQKVADMAAKDLGVKTWQTPGILLVFDTREGYRAFLGRLAEQLGCRPNGQDAAGFTTIGNTAASFYDPRIGALRPVFTHEFVHSLIGANLRLPNHNEWLNEGLATYYQLQFHPQKKFAKTLLDIIDKPVLPFEQLCNSQPISMNNYWQAATLVELLMKDPKYRPAFRTLLETFDKTGSSALDPQLQPILKTDWKTLVVDWKQYLRKQYGSEDGE